MGASHGTVLSLRYLERRKIMVHPSVVINSITYADCPGVDIPKSGGGTARFHDASEADITPGDILNGKKGIGANGEVVGNIQSKAAATYTPSSSSQAIAGGQYLSGAQTIEAVVCSNLLAQNIKSGVTVKVGTATDDDSVALVAGELTTPTVSQDSTTKILSIS